MAIVLVVRFIREIQTMAFMMINGSDRSVYDSIQSRYNNKHK